MLEVPARHLMTGKSVECNCDYGIAASANHFALSSLGLEKLPPLQIQAVLEWMCAATSQDL